uniref:SoHo domain-containing protein n=1 Tax=Amazona collaria TaxID=241587 RepID=A0A8B9FSF1_9PSIT
PTGPPRTRLGDLLHRIPLPPTRSPRSSPFLVLQVPVIHHHGSNTLNFDFHAPEAPGGRTRSPPAPAGPTPGPSAAPPGSRPPGWSATWTKDSRRRERRWVKYDGIGPVDETGMPIASRSSVDQPRDWYRSMFRQMHRRLPGEEPRKGLGCRELRAHPATGTPSAGAGCSRPIQPGLEHCQGWGSHSFSGHPVPVLLEQELEQLSVELDKDMRAMEARWEPCQVCRLHPSCAPWP